MAKLGDVKKCRLCEGKAVLRLIPESNAGPFGENGGLLAPRVPAYYAWECPECWDHESFHGEIETVIVQGVDRFGSNDAAACRRR
jgi:hypothetical protein